MEGFEKCECDNELYSALGTKKYRKYSALGTSVRVCMHVTQWKFMAVISHRQEQHM